MPLFVQLVGCGWQQAHATAYRATGGEGPRNGGTAEPQWGQAWCKG
jgi:hypothetical protein